MVSGLAYSQSLGAVGALFFILGYAVASILLLPGSLLTLAAGFSWGPGWGTLVAWTAANLASNASFLVGRFLARGWVVERTKQMPRFAAIDGAIAGSGLRLVLLLRLSPLVPFNLLNYALSVTKVRFRDYAVGGAVGMLPGTLLYVYLGCSLESLGQLLTGQPPATSPAKTWLFWLGLLATALSVGLVTRAASRELKHEFQHSEGPGD
ncbi:MAG: TVP38/TMEM64 family protein [Polyangiaceae bacterium]|nr:TVP38/TMEM64 family protein [Polyangiaceae bacterium]MCB9606083.1 TVP38/TMEM64 family protein [Polyangiaceae bacterium]